MRVARNTETQWLPIFVLVGLLVAVLLSALDLACDHYIYQALGRIFRITTPFVSFSLVLYLFGGVIGLAVYGATRAAQIRPWVDDCVVSATLIAACTGFLVGAMLLLDLLFVQVFPRFALASWVTDLIVGLTLFNALFFSAVFGGVFYLLLRGVFPGRTTATLGRRHVALLAAAAAFLIMGVFLANDMQVQGQMEGQEQGHVQVPGQGQIRERNGMVGGEVGADLGDFRAPATDSSAVMNAPSGLVEQYE